MPTPCNHKHDADVRCPDCQCVRESSGQLPRYAWILAAGLILGVLILLVLLQK